MEGGRGLKNNYIQSLCTNTQIHIVQIHKHAQIRPQIQFEFWRKMKKIKNFENLFQIEPLGSGFHCTFHWT